MSTYSQDRIDLYGLEYSRLKEVLAEWGYSHYFADKIWKAIYVHRSDDLFRLPDLRPDLLDTLSMRTYLHTPEAAAVLESKNGLTIKYLLRLRDGEQVECVTMNYDGRTTACISSQVGCAMGCVFCATGQMGFRRNLTRGEIVAQVVFLIRHAEQQGDVIRNVVFMGMGEPLHNYDETMSALDIITHDKGLAIAPKHVTISTVGLPKAIRRLAAETRPFNLAVSLHAATNQERSELVPVNSRWPLDELIDACREYAGRRNRRVFIEWALIKSKNDSEEQAHALGHLLEGIDSHVNLIPVNPTEGFAAAQLDPETVRRFQRALALHNVPSTVRQKRGIDIAAGCGQLRSFENRLTTP